MEVRANLNHGHILSGMEFSVESSAYAEVDNTWKWPGVSVPFNRLYLIKSGSALLWSGGEEIKMEPGMAYLLPAGLSCTYHCPDKMEKLFFHFNYLCLDRYDIFWDSDRIGCLPIPEGLLEAMINSLGGHSLADTLTIQQGILTMAAAFMRSCGLGRDTVDSYSELVTGTIAYIRNHLSARLRIDDLATHAFVSNSQLRHKFHRETGISLGRYIDEQLTMEAQRRLCQTEDTIGTISRDLGFCDQFYFSRRFTQLCGITPQVYRQSAMQILRGTESRPKR